MQWPERNLCVNQEVRLIEPEFKFKKKKKENNLNNLTTKQEVEREAKWYENYKTDLESSKVHRENGLYNSLYGEDSSSSSNTYQMITYTVLLLHLTSV